MLILGARCCCMQLRKRLQVREADPRLHSVSNPNSVLPQLLPADTRPSPVETNPHLCASLSSKMGPLKDCWFFGPLVRSISSHGMAITLKSGWSWKWDLSLPRLNMPGPEGTVTIQDKLSKDWSMSIRAWELFAGEGSISAEIDSEQPAFL